MIDIVNKTPIIGYLITGYSSHKEAIEAAFPGCVTAPYPGDVDDHYFLIYCGDTLHYAGSDAWGASSGLDGFTITSFVLPSSNPSASFSAPATPGEIPRTIISYIRMIDYEP